MAVAVPAALGAAKKLGSKSDVGERVAVGARTKDKLYDEAKRLGIEGRE